MTLQQRLTNALHSGNPAQALSDLVVQFSQEGLTKQEIVDQLERFVADWRARPEYVEDTEEPVLETLDALTGWCHPDRQLLPE